MTTTPETSAADIAALIAGDAAQITPPEPALPNGDNIAAAKSAIMDKFAEYGRNAANGTASLTHVAFLFAGAVRDKILSEPEAEAVYTAYVTAHNAALAEHHAVTGTAPLEVGKSSVSMFRTFGKPGPVAQPDLYQRVIVLAAQVKPEELVATSAYLRFVAVNRAITKAIDEAKGAIKPDALTIADAFILDALTKSEAKEKTDADRLAQVAAALNKLVKSGRFGGPLADIAGALVAYHGQYVAGAHRVNQTGAHVLMPASTMLGGVEIGATIN